MLKKISFYVFQGAATVILLVIVLRLWQFDLKTPFNYWGDTLWFSVLVKSVVQNGWAFFIPQLSAPFGFSAAAFPGMTNFDWLIMKLLSFFTRDATLILNVFWLMTIVFTAWTCSFALRILGVNNFLAGLSGILYAFIPYAWLRNTAHLALVYYCVPLLCVFTISLVQGSIGSWREKELRHVGLVGALLQGFSYIYFSYFAVMLFSAGAIIGYVKRKEVSVLKSAASAIIVILIASAINLAPSFYSWFKDGKPPELEYKSIAEAEIYGLRIRQMLLPNRDNSLPLLKYWAQKDEGAQFPHKNESETARLGLFGSVGFLLLLWTCLLGIKENHDEKLQLIKIMASLSLFTLLVSTVGGIGAVINTLVRPDIRCYNRFSVFISFFSIAALSLWVTAKMHKDYGRVHRTLLTGGILIFAALSLYDQTLDASPLINRYAVDMENAAHERAVVERIEEYFPQGTRVFQMPITKFPMDAGIVRMSVYEHARPYIWSRHLHWSWPVFSKKSYDFQNYVQNLKGAELVRALIAYGFNALWIDRYGYKDNGEAIANSLVASGAAELFKGISERYAIFDIQSVAISLKTRIGESAFEEETQNIKYPVSVNWGKGFYFNDKTAEGLDFRWSDAESSISVNNPYSKKRLIGISFVVQSGNPGTVEIIGGIERRQVIQTSVLPQRVEMELELEPNKPQEIIFMGNMQKMVLPGDVRNIYFNVIGLTISDISPKK